jgi:hypothetical protein
MTPNVASYSILPITYPSSRVMLKAAFNMEPNFCHIQLYRP